MSIIVTGGAGFIGSCLVRHLNDRGVTDIIIVDNIASTEKWKNLLNKRFAEYVHKNELLSKLKTYDGITHIVHLGACSNTEERDFDYLYRNNYAYSAALWNYCVERNIQFIYASSAATYGDGLQGFDDEIDIESLHPLNSYGYSKQLFDLWAKEQSRHPPQYVGLKLFNVYGPNEYCKGFMASMVYHGFCQVRDTGKIRLFKSYKTDYDDGGQLRDFIYVKDVCKVIYFFMNSPSISGIFNVGTGRASSFAQLARAVFAALGNVKQNIEYIDMPETLQDRYQYYTQAKMNKLKSAGYVEPFYDVYSGCNDYVTDYLMNNFTVY